MRYSYIEPAPQPAPVEHDVPRMPEHTSEMPWPANLELPRGPRVVATLAQRHGWQTLTTYARSADKLHTIALRVKRNGFAGYAIWERKDHEADWRATTVGIRTPHIFPWCNITDLREWLEDPLRSEAWFNVIRERKRQRTTVLCGRCTYVHLPTQLCEQAAAKRRSVTKTKKEAGG